jgi:hypothetical protein
MVDWLNPATAIAGGEGGGVGKHQGGPLWGNKEMDKKRHYHVGAHLGVAGIGSGWAVAVARRGQCGRRWS